MYIPSNIHNYEDLKMEPPSERLELDWVYPSIMSQQQFGLLILSVKRVLHSGGALISLDSSHTVLENISLIVL